MSLSNVFSILRFSRTVSKGGMYSSSPQNISFSPYKPLTFVAKYPTVAPNAVPGFVTVDCKEELDEVDDKSKYVGKRTPCCSVVMKPTGLESLLGFDADESVVFGEEFFSLFFIVEFQKFFISLSVRPGNRAAI